MGTILYLRNDIKKYFSPPFLFEKMMALRGKTFRFQEGRLTQRIFLGNQHYFIKQHFGIGWREILKNLCMLRLPVVGAKNEWQAIKSLNAWGIQTPAIVGFGQRGFNPAHRQSFILMEELTPSISLADLSLPIPFHAKILLIISVAKIARLMHQSGVNHRDFYLCHFLLTQDSHNMLMQKNVSPDKLHLYLIDLHRAQIRSRTPTRWIIKDLAGLYFSAQEKKLTKRDFFRFMRVYDQEMLREILNSKRKFWQKVKTRGEKLYRKERKKNA